ncbi:unnamed protein product [Polarella glacialis]|uniref:Pentacotripeptide-repeat region of PRORP domain-containing protein n=1 Tax=Polarella glacialis TaxID=89957 RepID=A0A813L206_POLGL|nr:unnamed protein product [Polarella glacialis]
MADGTGLRIIGTCIGRSTSGRCHECWPREALSRSAAPRRAQQRSAAAAAAKLPASAVAWGILAGVLARRGPFSLTAARFRRRRTHSRWKAKPCAAIELQDAASQTDASELREELRRLPSNSGQETFALSIGRLGRGRQWQAVLELWEEMGRRSVLPQRAAFEAALKAFGGCQRADLCEEWIASMTEQRLVLGQVSYASVITTLARVQQADRADQWLGEMQQAGLMPDKRIASAVVNAFTQQGNVDRAETIFGQMLEARVDADEVSYNILINACAKGASFLLSP